MGAPEHPIIPKDDRVLRYVRPQCPRLARPGPASSLLWCVRRPKTFFPRKRKCIFNASSTLKPADFISKKGVDTKKCATPCHSASVFLVKFPGFRLISKNLGDFLEIRRNPGKFTKNDTLQKGPTPFYINTLCNNTLFALQ